MIQESLSLAIDVVSIDTVTYVGHKAISSHVIQGTK